MNLLSLKFWFSLRPEPLFPSSEFILLAIFAALVVASIVLKLISKNKKFDEHTKQRLLRLNRMFLTMGLIGLFWLFFSYERAYILGARFLFLFWGIGFLVWLGFILRDFYKKLPKDREGKRNQEVFEKYLPKPKRKK